MDRRLGVVAAGHVVTLQLPAWAANGRSTVPTGIASIDSIPVPLTAAKRASTTITIDNPRNKPMMVFAEQGVRSVGGTWVDTRTLNLKSGDQIAVDIVF
ncbi:hypothetical protein [Gemmatimonas groenlandica]|uniref:Uncharacterized protein n=1 Tax=Gemmatimonas groenlandica TaxID=2732249 RepID=A0A6M4IVZ7_9BACT|nr:hypothetical protein [Gemmatimonas groenlandica]QJR37696.1 hypothetical protein HKW67_20310 [Gemmatimonas groenlandica]